MIVSLITSRKDPSCNKKNCEPHLGEVPIHRLLTQGCSCSSDATRSSSCPTCYQLSNSALIFVRTHVVNIKVDRTIFAGCGGRCRRFLSNNSRTDGGVSSGSYWLLIRLIKRVNNYTTLFGRISSIG